MKKSIAVLGMIMMFANCSSQKNVSVNTEIDTEANLENAYYQTWVSGVQGGGSGFDLFINKSLLKPNEVALKVFFRGQEQTLESTKEMYIARFKTVVNQVKDYEMNSDSKKEYGNEFKANNEYKELQTNEAILTVAILTVNQLGKERRIRLKNIARKENLPYPSVKN